MIQRNCPEPLRDKLTLGAADIKTALGRFGKACGGLVEMHSLTVEPHGGPDTRRSVTISFELEVEFESREQAIDDLREAIERGLRTMPQPRNDVLSEGSRTHTEIDTEVA